MYDQGPQATTGHLDLLDALPIMILDVDADGTLRFANKKVRERVGLPSDLEDLTLANVLDDSSLPEAMRQLQDLFSGESDITSTWKLKARNGVIQVDTNALTIYENGYPFRVRLYLHDGSEIVAQAPAATPNYTGPVDVRAALKEEQEYTKALIQKSGLLVYILDTKGNVVEVNKKMEEVTGFSREMSPSLDALLAGLYPDPKYRNIVERIHQNMYKNQHIRETELSITTRAGEVKHVSWSTARLKNAQGQVHGFIAMGADVSEKKRLEQWVKLQSSCFDRVSDGVVVSDLTGKIINWVGGAERLLGYAGKDMVGKPFADLFPADDREEMAASLASSIDRDQKWSAEMILTTAEGRRLAARIDSAVILNEKGAPIATVSVIHDQTQVKQLHGQLEEQQSEIETLNGVLNERDQEIGQLRPRNDELERRNEYLANKNRDLEQETSRLAAGRTGLEEAVKELQIYQLQVLGAGAPIVTLDPAGTILTWSRGIEELTGIDANQAFNRHHDEVFKLEEFDWEMLQSEAQQKTRVALPCTVIRPDGVKQAVNLEISVLNDDGGQPLSYIEVVTPQAVQVQSGLGEEFVRELVDARNLGTLGELAVGVARETGDAYSALNSNLKRLRDYTADLKKVVELYRSGVSNRDIESYARRIDLKSILSDLDFLFDESQESVGRIRTLTQDLTAYVPDSDGLEALNVNELAESALSLLKGELHNRARIEKHYGDPALLLANRNLAMRVMINVLRAAARSFEQGTSAPKNEIRIDTLLDGSRVVIEVVHNGRAVDGEVVEHLGDLAWLARVGGQIPLSLGIAYQLVTGAQGSMRVLARAEGGSTIRISFPASEDAGNLNIPDDQERTEPQGNVLFVDDDKNQLRSFRRYFERYYHVFQADNIDEALNALSVRQDFAAIVMDILAPEGDGLRLYKQLVERQPQLKERVVFLVPPGLSAETRDFLSHTGRILLHKPVEMDSLATILAHVRAR